MFNINAARSAKLSVQVNNTNLSVLIDSGASSNLLDRNTAKSVGCVVKPTNKQKFAYGNNSACLDLIGETDVNVFVPSTGKCVHAKFYIFNGTVTTLLCKSTSEQLGVLRVGPVGEGVHFASSDLASGDGQSWLDMFPGCFAGVGLLKDLQVSLHIDPNAKPVAQPVRSMLFGHRNKAKAKIDELLAADIIDRVEGPTPWVSPIVTVPKDGNDIRLCVDMRQANKAIIRERHLIPTVKELMYNLNGANVFSKVDLKLGYHQLELDEASRAITKFVTPLGVFRYKKLNFGVASASEIHQYHIQRSIADLEGCQNYADDIVIYGSNKQEHDARLRAFFKRMSKLGLTLNAEKFKFGCSKRIYVSYDISDKGISVSDKKVKAIVQARVPKDVTELRSFLGLVNFVGKFIPNLSTHAEPLLRLVKKASKFQWSSEQQAAFDKIKSMVLF